MMMRNREKGNVLVLTGLALSVLLGMAGLAVDVGALRYEKRLQQTAADSAAIAGASNIGFGGVDAGAKAASKTNGFENGVGNVTVTVNNPPANGPHKNDTNYVEVFVQKVHPTYFMKIFGVTTATVQARAVATAYGGGNNTSGCMYTLGEPSKGIGVNINGSAIVNATSCGIVDNGNFNTSGSKLIINAGTFGVSGDWNSSGKSTPDVTCSQSATCPVTGMPSTQDPYSMLQPPCTSCTVNSTYANGQTVVNPGIYNGINIAANSTVTFNPGTYVITGSNLSIGGGSTINGTGVTFYFTNNASIDAEGTSTIKLTAPSTGDYTNILFYQDPTDTTVAKLGGTNGSYFDGVAYFPNNDLIFYGDATGATYAVVVANSIDFSGNPTVNLAGAAGLPSGNTYVHNAVLVE